MLGGSLRLVLQILNGNCLIFGFGLIFVVVFLGFLIVVLSLLLVLFFEVLVDLGLLQGFRVYWELIVLVLVLKLVLSLFLLLSQRRFLNHLIFVKLELSLFQLV